MGKKKRKNKKKQANSLAAAAAATTTTTTTTTNNGSSSSSSISKTPAINEPAHDDRDGEQDIELDDLFEDEQTNGADVDDELTDLFHNKD